MIKLELERKDTEEKEGEKRHYMPYILKWNCEKCGKKIITDFNEDYFSYPKLEKPIERTMYYECECGHDNEIKAGFIIKEVLELIGPK